MQKKTANTTYGAMTIEEKVELNILSCGEEDYSGLYEIMCR